MFSEDFLHYIWKFKLFKPFHLKTTQKESIEIIDVGLPNYDAGPDFFNAKIKIGNTLWAGNVEIHINSSEWDKHQHYKDKAYNNVILHVVYQNDKSIFNELKKAIPTLELKNILNQNVLSKYQLLKKSITQIPCANQLKNVEVLTINNWIDRLAIERLERKSSEIVVALSKTNYNWDKIFYQNLFKYFGLKVNGEPFYQLAKSISLKIFEKHNSLLEIEALLFGQAGFLEIDCDDEYFLNLKKEYRFLKSKFNLTKLSSNLFKFSKLRPDNFPTIRLSQLANLLKNDSRLFSYVLEAKNENIIREKFKIKASIYWENHYKFGVISSKNKIKNVGNLTINNIIINVICPILFVYGKEHNHEKIIEKALLYLCNLPAETNKIIKSYQDLNIKISNAMQTQGLLELQNSYCSRKKCLNCNIGNKILQNDK